MDRLEEAIRICLQMWSGSEEPFDGEYYHLGRTLNSPQPLSGKPSLMIGGGGEKRTLKLVAQYADACNIFAGPDAAHKLDVLRAHCDALGRDYDTIEKTAMMGIGPDSTTDDVVRTGEELAALGYTTLYVFAVGIRDRAAIIDLLAGAVPRLG
jgi:alkanesulfonate monooxygenase